MTGAAMRASPCVPLLMLAAVAACGTEPSPPPPPLAGRIVFSSTRQSPASGTPLLYSMHPDGSDVQLIPIPLPPSLSQADVAPSGDRLAFVRDGIYPVAASGAGLHHIVPDPAAGHPRWLPDGTHIAYSAPIGTPATYDIWVANADGSDPVDLTPTDSLNEFPGGWSADGTRLVYSAYPPGPVAYSQLWIVNADGTSPHRIPVDSADWPALSPDGVWVAYTADGTALRVIHADGTGDHLLLAAPDSGVAFPAWSPDGQTLAFDYSTSIALIHPDGTGFRVIADSAVNDWAAWGPALKP
jgi:Tol biopolymer transport system component